MKKLLTSILAALMAVCACFALVGCDSDDPADKLNFGKELVKADGQLDTLTMLDNGTIDVSVIDSVMAGYYCTMGQYKDKIQMLNLVLAEEQYGIAGRKEDKAFVSVINDALISIASTGYAEVAAEYGLTSSCNVTADTVNPLANANDNSWNEIKNSGKIVVGYTVFAPICYEVVAGTPTKGFDIDLAKKVVEFINQDQSLNLAVEFVEIDWDSKEALLANGTIDLIWNGMTITPEREAEMCISVPYLKNYQSAVVLKEDAAKYAGATMDNLQEVFKDAIIGVEAGSAGEGVVVKA